MSRGMLVGGALGASTAIALLERRAAAPDPCATRCSDGSPCSDAAAPG